MQFDLIDLTDSFVRRHVDWFALMPVKQKFYPLMGNPKSEIYARESHFWNMYRYKKEWIFPIHECKRKIYGQTVPCPAQEEAILKYIFDADFMDGRTIRKTLSFFFFFFFF